MKINRTILFCIILLFTCILNANIQSKVKALNDLKTYHPDLRPLYQERDRLISQARKVSPKGEFEKEVQYRKRLAEAERQVEKIRNEYSDKEQAFLRNVEKQKRVIQAQIDALLMESLENFSTKNFNLRTYNAEKEEFPIFISDISKTVYVKIPLHRAQFIKVNSDKYQLEGVRQLNENIQWEYKNWCLSGLGERYAIGTHESIISTTIDMTNYQPPNLFAKISFREPSGNNYLDAEETGTIEITLENKGEGPAIAVEANVFNNDSADLVFDRYTYFGDIESGQSITKHLNVRAKDIVSDRTQILNIEFTEHMGMTPRAQTISFNSRAMRAPSLVLAEKAIHSTDGRISAGTVTELILIIQNQGEGTARNVKVELFPGDGATLLGVSEVVAIGDINPRANRECRVSFAVSSDAQTLPFHIRIIEQRMEYNTDIISLDLPFVRAHRPAQVTSIKGKDFPYEIEPLPHDFNDLENNIPLGKERKNAYAIVLGIEDYQNLPPANYALRDALWMKEYFKNALGIPEANIISYENDKVTRSRLATVFDEKHLSKLVKDKNTELYVYYSGHGAPPPLGGNQAYLAAWDADFASIENTCYPIDDIYIALNKIKTQNVTVFIDACFSGISKDKVSLKAGRPVFIVPTNSKAIGDLTVFTAGEADEIAHVYDSKKHGMFTYHLLKGIHDGNADKNRDGKITVQELKDYLSENVPSAVRIEKGEFQNPQVYSNDLSRVLVEFQK